MANVFFPDLGFLFVVDKSIPADQLHFVHPTGKRDAFNMSGERLNRLCPKCKSEYWTIWPECPTCIGLHEGEVKAARERHWTYASWDMASPDPDTIEARPVIENGKKVWKT